MLEDDFTMMEKDHDIYIKHSNNKKLKMKRN